MVADVSRASLPAETLTGGDQPDHLATDTSDEDDCYDESIQVIWENEPGTRVLDKATLPNPDLERLGDPERLAAFLDAVR